MSDWISYEPSRVPAVSGMATDCVRSRPRVYPPIAQCRTSDASGRGPSGLYALVTGLALIGDRVQCGALYPLTLDYIRTGQRVSTVALSIPQLVAALAADAAGLADKSREHFETALQQTRDVPIRIFQPTVSYWYGRALSAAADPADRARGRAMVEAALADFRGLGMVLHAALAEQFLRGLAPNANA